jgi:hypothetical protein
MLAVLPEPARLMARFLACLEEDDRVRDVITANWPGLWRRLDGHGDPPDPGPLLDELASAALMQTETVPPQARSAASDLEPAVVYRLHPGVAIAIQAAAPDGIRDVVDGQLGTYWQEVVARAQDGEGGEDSGVIIHAGLAAAPYLLRSRRWDTASYLLELAEFRDDSPRTTQAVLPAFRQIAEATASPKDRGVLGKALMPVDPAQAERVLQESLSGAIQQDDYELADGLAGQLANLHRDAGRLVDALEFGERAADYARRAGRGPWSQLGGKARLLQILALKGEHKRVLADFSRLQGEMDKLSSQLPVADHNDEGIAAWNVREFILDVGFTSALALKKWQRCLDINAEIVAIQRRREAGSYEISRTLVSVVPPLMMLNRHAAAEEVLRECQQVFESEADLSLLAMVFSYRAHIAGRAGHASSAVNLEAGAIRLSYGAAAPRNIAVCHHQLANYFLKASDNPIAQRAHRLAAALLFLLMGMDHHFFVAGSNLKNEVRRYRGHAVLPSTLDDVIHVAEKTDGVRLGALLAELQPDSSALSDSFANITRTAVRRRGKPYWRRFGNDRRAGGMD